MPLHCRASIEVACPLADAMVNFADAAVGNVTEAFKRKGMYEDMLVVFSSE